MGRRKRTTNRKRQEDRDLSIRAIRRSVPDEKKLSRAFIGLALAQAQAEADAEQTAKASRRGEPEQEAGHEHRS